MHELNTVVFAPTLVGSGRMRRVGKEDANMNTTTTTKNKKSKKYVVRLTENERAYGVHPFHRTLL